MNDYRELQSYLSHSKKKSSAGMPTNLKQESSNIKRASERAKFMNQLQQIWNRLTVLDQQITRLRRNNLRTTESKERDLPDGGKELVTNYKSGGSHSAVTELTKAWDKYLKEEQQLSKKAYNLINMGKNDPMFTRLEQEKMKVLIKNADDVDTNKIRDLLEFIFSHSEIDNYLAHGYEAAMHNKKQSQESVKRQYEDVNGTVQRLKDAAIKDIMFYIKDYNNIIERYRQRIVKAKNMLNSPAGTQAKSSYVKTNSGQPSIREEIKVLEYSMNKNIEKKEALEKELQEIKSDKTGKKAKAYVDGHKNDLHHSSFEEDNMTNEYTEIHAYLQHGLFDIFKSKPKYNSTGSAAGMPSNIHLGDSYNPAARASAIQDQIVRMTNKLAEYENGEVKAKADYDRYKKLVKETKAKLSDLEKARANAVTQSVNSNTKKTTVTSSVPNQTRLVRTNPIFDRDVANLRKKR